MRDCTIRIAKTKALMRLCFRICKKPVFSQQGSYHKISNITTFKMHSQFRDALGLKLFFFFQKPTNFNVETIKFQP